MRKSRFTEQQIIGFLKQAEAGMPVAELCRQGGFSDATFYKWRSKFGGMDEQEARRLKNLGGQVLNSNISYPPIRSTACFTVTIPIPANCPSQANPRPR